MAETLNRTADKGATRFVRPVCVARNGEGGLCCPHLTFKHGVIGVYQHCGEAHLHRYLAEFDFRYNRRAALKITDSERHDQLLAMVEGKRLTYRRIGEAGNA